MDYIETQAHVRRDAAMLRAFDTCLTLGTLATVLALVLLLVTPAHASGWRYNAPQETFTRHAPCWN